MLDTDKLDAAFEAIDRNREAGMRLGEAAAHAAVDTQVGDHEELLFVYCRRDDPDRAGVMDSGQRRYDARATIDGQPHVFDFKTRRT